MTEADPPWQLPPPGNLPPPPPPPPSPRFGRSPTLDELLPPVEPDPPYWRRHRRGLIIGVAVMAVVAVVVAISLLRRDEGLGDAKVGDCLVAEIADDRTFKSGQIVDCSKPHTREVYAVGSTDKQVSLVPDPPDPELVRICRTEVDPKILETLAAVGNLQIGFFISTDRTGRVICVAEGPERTGSDLEPAG